MPPAPRYSPEEQEKLILEAAAKVVEESSILDFTMSAIAKEAGISMGSVYKHVQTKEDVLLALATGLFNNLHDKFSRIFELSLTTPECMAAINLADCQVLYRYDYDPQLELLITNKALLNRGSEYWRDRMFASQERLDNLMHEHINNAVETGELRCEGDPKICTDQLGLGIWALAVGFNQVSLQTSGVSLFHGGDSWAAPYEPKCAQVRNFMAVINAVDWAEPLTEEGINKVCQVLEEIDYR